MPSPRAINAGGARIRLTLHDDLQRGLRRAEYRMRAFGSKISSIGRSMVSLSAKILAPLSIGAKVFADFETQMAKVATMLDEPQKHMAMFRKGIKDLSVEFGQSTETLADGLYDILSGYRAFNRDFVTVVPLLTNQFEIETEMTIQALSKGLTVKEVPVSYKERPSLSKSKLSPFGDGAMILFTITTITGKGLKQRPPRAQRGERFISTTSLPLLPSCVFNRCVIFSYDKRRPMLL